MDKTIKNINFLDLTSATEESLEDVAMIKNINLLIFNKQISKLLSKISMKNVNSSLEVPENAKLRKGVFEFDQSYGKSLDEEQHLVIKGMLIIKPDVTLEALEKLTGVTISGDVLCPEKLQGIIQNKIDHHLGKFNTYMDNADILLKELNASKPYLETLKNSTKLVVTGKSSLISDVNLSLLQTKIEKVQFLDNVVIREEYMEALEGRVYVSDKAKLTVIPTDTHYIDDDIQIDSATITRFEHAKIYATGNIQLANDISAELLNECIDEMYSEENIFCKKDMLSQVMKKCKDSSVSIIGYEGKLIRVDGEDKITQSQLKYTSDKLTYFVRGVLVIAENVDPEELFNKVDGVHLFGVITGNEEQCGVIQTKMITKNGVISSDSEFTDEFSPESPDEQNVIANMNYLKI